MESWDSRLIWLKRWPLPKGGGLLAFWFKCSLRARFLLRCTNMVQIANNQRRMAPSVTFCNGPVTQYNIDRRYTLFIYIGRYKDFQSPLRARQKKKYFRPSGYFFFLSPLGAL
jgi:hypothetical protein